MNAGELKEVIKFQRLQSTISASGAESATYTDLCSVRAKVTYGRGWRSVVNDEIVYSKSVYFTIRNHVKVENTDIVVYKSEKYRIMAVEYRGEEMSIELTTELINE